MHVAIVIPAWNVAPWIGDALGSVLRQTHADWTLAVVDDGSTDATAHVVAGFPDRRIRLIAQANAGVAAARNRGAAETGGDAILFLDADDWLAPDALSRLAVSLAGAPGAVAAVSPFTFVGERETPCTIAGPWRARAAPGGDLLPTLLERNLFANGGHVLIRRDAMLRAGSFSAALAYGEDWEFWVRLALLGPFATVPGNRPLLFVRQRASGAYLRMAREAASFDPCMDTIFGNVALLPRFGRGGLAALRRRAEAENRWIIGRELVRHGRMPEGRASLRRSACAKPSVKRAGLLAAAHLLPWLPQAARGPFRAYPR